MCIQKNHRTLCVNTSPNIIQEDIATCQKHAIHMANVLKYIICDIATK